MFAYKHAAFIAFIRFLHMGQDKEVALELSSPTLQKTYDNGTNLIF